jgi:membrane protease YdiL (CAAX protease family)
LICALLVVWSGHIFLLIPWLKAHPSPQSAQIEQISQLLILGGLPLLWVWRLDPATTWHSVVRPLPGHRHRASAVLAWTAVGIYALLTWAGLGSGLGAVTQQGRVPQHVWDIAPSAAVLVMVRMASVAALEETLFRGYFLGRLSHHFGVIPGILGQALAFTALHAVGWVVVWHSPVLPLIAWSLEAFAFALVTGAVVRLQGGLLAVMALHLLVNILRWDV